MSFLGISSINIFSWILFGLGIGVFTYLKDPYQSKGGFIPTALFAIFGAFVGGYLATFLLDTAATEFNTQGFFTAIGSAILLAIFYRFAFRNTNLT